MSNRSRPHSIYLPDELWEAAVARGGSAASVVVAALRYYLGPTGMADEGQPPVSTLEVQAAAEQIGQAALTAKTNEFVTGVTNDSTQIQPGQRVTFPDKVNEGATFYRADVEFMEGSPEDVAARRERAKAAQRERDKLLRGSRKEKA